MSPEVKTRDILLHFKNLLKDISLVVNLVSGLAILIVSINWVIRFTYCKILTWDKSFGIYPYPDLMGEKCMRVLWAFFIRKLFLRPKTEQFFNSWSSVLAAMKFTRKWSHLVHLIRFMLYLKAIQMSYLLSLSMSGLPSFPRADILSYYQIVFLC